HGAQCGYCTPGIIMSLFTLHTEKAVSGDATNDHELLEALSGNLCRCTGYRPIVEAGRRASVQAWDPDTDSSAQDKGQKRPLGDNIIASGPAWLQAPDMVANLQKLQGTTASVSDERGFRYDAPSTLDELRKL